MKFKRYPVSVLIQFAKEQAGLNTKRIERRSQPHLIVNDSFYSKPYTMPGMLFCLGGFY